MKRLHVSLAVDELAPSVLGIQVEAKDELTEVYSRLKAAERPILEQGAVTCCYAESEKSWISDPQGVAWKAFLTRGGSTVYGEDTDLGAVTEGSTCSALPTFGSRRWTA